MLYTRPLLSFSANALTALALATCIAVSTCFADDEADPFEEAEKEAAKESSVMLLLDASPLSDAYKVSEIGYYKCRTLVQDFKCAVSNANVSATSKRERLQKTVRDSLLSWFEKAQASGNLEMALAFKEALDSTKDGEIKGDAVAIENLRANRDKQLAQIDRELVVAGVAAARSLHAGFGFHKQEFTKKGDFEKARQVATYQQKVEEWAKSTQLQALEARQATTATVKPPERQQPAAPRPQPRPPANEVKRLEPEVKIVTIDARNKQGTSIGRANVGDTLEIQYVGGKWHTNRGEPVVSPDAHGIYGGGRCLLVLRNGQNLTVAELPPDTKSEPYRYSVDDEFSGEFALRIRDSWADGSQGSVRYSVKIIPGEATKATTSIPTQPVRRQPLQNTSSIATSAKIVTVDARNQEGTSIGRVKAGDAVEIQYVSGKWASGRDHAVRSPDTEEWPLGVICREKEWRYVLAKIPNGTKASPFRYDAEEDEELALRIDDQGCGDNAGSVRYSVKIIHEEATKETTGKPTQLVQQPLPTAPPTSASRLSNQTLTGTQTEVSVQLAKRPQPYIVREQYLVPEGKELIVDAGVIIIFEEGASLYCEGTLKMNGTERAPIICKGHMPKVGYWNGITVKTNDSEINWLRVRDANKGMICFGASPKIRDSVFTGNRVGINFNNSSASFENCLICDNEVDGIACDYSGRVRPSFSRCTFSGNGITGVACGYYGSPQLDSCLITKNKKYGVNTYLYGCEVKANNCIIMDNKGYDVEHNASPKVDFRKNYWGPSVTRLLQQRGDGANLSNIKDGRDSGGGNIVDVSEFLTEPPKDCGATVKW